MIGAGLEQLAAAEAALEVEAGALLGADPQLELAWRRPGAPSTKSRASRLSGTRNHSSVRDPVDATARVTPGAGEDALGLEPGEDADVVLGRRSAEDHGRPLR